MNHDVLKSIKALPNAKGDEVSKDAKKLAIKKLKGELNAIDGEKMFSEEGPSKVTVASDSPEGLREGLETAEALVSEDDGDSDTLDAEDHSPDLGEDSDESEVVDILEDLDKLSDEEIRQIEEAISKRKSMR